MKIFIIGAVAAFGTATVKSPSADLLPDSADYSKLVSSMVTSTDTGTHLYVTEATLGEVYDLDAPMPPLPSLVLKDT